MNIFPPPMIDNQFLVDHDPLGGKFSGPMPTAGYYDRVTALQFRKELWADEQTFYLQSLISETNTKINTPELNNRRRIEHLIADKLILAAGINAENAEWFYDLSDKMKSCRLHGHIGQKGDGYNIAWTTKCSQALLCPDESRSEQRRLSNKYTWPISNWSDHSIGRSVHYCVLTSKNVPAGELKNEKQKVYKRLRNQLNKFKNIKGCLAVQEDPLSADNEWNVHINLILLVSGRFSYKEWRSKWKNNLHIRMLQKNDVTDAVRELIKYSVKHISSKEGDKKKSKAPGLLDWELPLFVEWMEANKLFRRSRSYGNLYSIHKRLWMNEDAIIDEQRTRKGFVSTAKNIEKNINPDFPSIEDSLIEKDWKEIKTRQKVLIGRAMDEGEPDMEKVTWIGSIQWDAQKSNYHINLIQGDKSPLKNNKTTTDPPLQ